MCVDIYGLAESLDACDGSADDKSVDVVCTFVSVDGFLKTDETRQVVNRFHDCGTGLLPINIKFSKRENGPK